MSEIENDVPWDYVNKDGILICGVCHEPKQQRVEWLDGEMRIVPAACQCVRERQKAEQEKREFEQFQLSVYAMQEKYGLTDTAYRNTAFDRDDGANAEASEICHRYVDTWGQMRENGFGMLLFGSVGTGKSFLAYSVVNELLKRKVRATVTNIPRILNVLQNAKDRQEVVDHLRYFELLVIDDLGAERESGYAAEQVFSIIDSRAKDKLPLIVTTNLTMEEIEKPSSMQYKRIYDRVLELCPITIKLNGESRRTQAIRERQAKAKAILRGVSR